MLERELGLIENLARGAGVTYEIFLAHYWNTFPAASTQGLGKCLQIVISYSASSLLQTPSKSLGNL